LLEGFEGRFESGAPGGSGLGAVEEDSPWESWARTAGAVRTRNAATGSRHRAMVLWRTIGCCI
jgi:hypothetical protein